jgi:hypothetical protein
MSGQKQTKRVSRIASASQPIADIVGTPNSVT